MKQSGWWVITCNMAREQWSQYVWDSWGHGVRKPPGGNFRRWFRIRCQNFNWTYGRGDTVIRNFAEEIFPTRLLTDPGVFWTLIQNPLSEIKNNSPLRRYSTFNEKSYTFTWLSRDQRTYMQTYIHIHIHIHIHRTYAYTHTYTVNNGTCPIL